MNAALVIFTVLCPCVAIAQALEPPIDVAQVAEAFDVSVSSIRRTVKTDEVVSKHGDSIHSASLFEFELDPNVSMQVVVTKGHFLLSDSLRSKLEEDPALIEKVEVKNGGAAFVGNEGAGPGAEGYVAIGHLPSQNVDFRLRIMISNDGTTASGVSELSALRSSPFLKRALRILAISSSAKLSQDFRVSAPVAQATQPIKPSENLTRNAQGIEKVTTEQNYQRTLPKQKINTWNPLVSAFAAAFSILLVAIYWHRQKNSKNQKKGYFK